MGKRCLLIAILPEAIPPEATMPVGAFYGQEGAFWDQEATQARKVLL